MKNIYNYGCKIYIYLLLGSVWPYVLGFHNGRQTVVISRGDKIDCHVLNPSNEIEFKNLGRSTKVVG